MPCAEQVLGSWLVPETGLGRGGTEPQGKGWLPKWRWQKTVNHTGFETGPWCTAQADLELLIHLLHCTECWDDTCMLLRCVACEFAILLLWPQGLGLQIHTSTSCLMTHCFVEPMHGQVILRSKIFRFYFFLLESEPRHHTDWESTLPPGLIRDPSKNNCIQYTNNMLKESLPISPPLGVSLVDQKVENTPTSLGGLGPLCLNCQEELQAKIPLPRPPAWRGAGRREERLESHNCADFHLSRLL